MSLLEPQHGQDICWDQSELRSQTNLHVSALYMFHVTPVFIAQSKSAALFATNTKCSIKVVEGLLS